MRKIVAVGVLSLTAILAVGCTAILGDFQTGPGGESSDAGDGGRRDTGAPHREGGRTDAEDARGDHVVQGEMDGRAEAKSSQDGPGDSGEGCDASQTACAGGCVDTQKSASNCGGCGNTCAPTFDCVQGVCGNAVVSVIAGTSNTCAVLVRGDVYCWGANDAGALGQGSQEGGTSMPVLVARDINGATVIGALGLTVGMQHVCTLNDDGITECWGSDYSGQAGGSYSEDGGPDNTPTPTPEHQTSHFGGANIPFASLGTGPTANHGCAAVEAGARCWGDNQYEQLGHSNHADAALDNDCYSGPCQPVPALVPLLASAPAQMAVGESFTCALLSKGGSAECWGLGTSGQLGRGTRSIAVPALELVLDAGAVAIDAGLTSIGVSGFFGCATDVGGQVWCWGDDESDQLGHDPTGGDGGLADPNCNKGGPFAPCEAVPLPVTGLSEATLVVAGCDHACALKSDGTVWCWGSNDQGQLGTGDTMSGFAPRMVVGLTGATSISAGCEHTCAVTGDSGVFCWGTNIDGELGSPSVANLDQPTPVVGLPQH